MEVTDIFREMLLSMWHQVDTCNDVAKWNLNNAFLQQPWTSDSKSFLVSLQAFFFLVLDRVNGDDWGTKRCFFSAGEPISSATDQFFLNYLARTEHGKEIPEVVFYVIVRFGVPFNLIVTKRAFLRLLNSNCFIKVNSHYQKQLIIATWWCSVWLAADRKALGLI